MPPIFIAALVGLLLLANPILLAILLGFAALGLQIAGYSVAIAAPFCLVKYFLMQSATPTPAPAPAAVKVPAPPRTEIRSAEFYRSLYWK